ncbi:hypothetical protein GUJ93_ZPchr0004g38456 [Zizania palustris]|uniref:BRX domain-containing protein n=1 Tax=Zizania palustris TaxID=103762 RepID=A0A8J5SNT6_ZIZPA|nr:hypothetical protein GUJ93_ZPchr0004g38456 [Zizania palustris]
MLLAFRSLLGSCHSQVSILTKPHYSPDHFRPRQEERGRRRSIESLVFGGHASHRLHGAQTRSLLSGAIHLAIHRSQVIEIEDSKMLACIACSSKEGGEDGSRTAATPHNKDAVKSLTSQLKDMVLKFSGSSKQYKQAAAGSPSRSYRRPYPGFIDDSAFMTTTRPGGEAYTYRRATAAVAPPVRAASSSSSTTTATWDMTRSMSSRGWQQDAAGRSPGGTTWIPSIEEAEEAAGDEVHVVDDAVPREWTAQVEPGVQITFVTLAGGGNDLKRIRFSRESFNKWEAQRWWGENYDRIVELYNVQTFSGRQQGVSTPTSSVDDSVLVRSKRVAVLLAGRFDQGEPSRDTGDIVVAGQRADREEHVVQGDGCRVVVFFGVV